MLLGDNTVKMTVFVCEHACSLVFAEKENPTQYVWIKDFNLIN